MSPLGCDSEVSVASSAEDPLHRLMMPVATARKKGVPGPYLRLMEDRDNTGKDLIAPLAAFIDCVMDCFSLALARNQVFVSSAQRSAIRHRLTQGLQQEFGTLD
ncbi:hypothetical protein ColTof4_14319 [Colletotrichum tofieldiae]|nr:hypothetical protein ColTof3_14728 [Colletotrichum tofieldiae]GKT81896.1 hypothetical protein ColTof4_14319 [Colletotrichum tofieldiae]